MNIREAIDQVMIEEEAEANNATVDTLIPQRNESENSNDQINEVANLKIKDVENNLINKVTKFRINDARDNSNEATASDVQVQFSRDSDGISHQDLLNSLVIGMGQEEVPGLFPPT